jgi:stage II sporulation protein GA (sporulation sigma-E factor processing peptidase)
MKIYADIFFIVNLSMDLLLFLVVAPVLRAEKKFGRFLAASIVTASFPISQLIFPGNEKISFFIGLLAVFAACMIAFYNSKFIKIALSFVLFSLLSSAVSEGLVAFYKYLDTLKLLPEIKGTSGGIIPLSVCIFSLVMSWIISRAVKLFKKKAMPLKTTLTVISDGKELEMSAYCDSGNLLREPVGGLPVIITGKEQMENIIPKSLHSVFFSSKTADEPSLSDARRVRIIPIKPLGTGGARILFGYVPDKIMLGDKEVKGCIALDNGSSKFGGCEALLPSSLIT